MCIGEIHMYILSTLSLSAEFKSIEHCLHLLKFYLGNSVKVVANYMK